MILTLPGPLVSTAWLAANFDARSIKVLDGSFVMPDSGRDIHDEFAAAHIPGAQLFDIDEIKDSANPLPHTVPSAVDFGRAVGAFGIDNTDAVVIYDTTNIAMAAARVWWMFRLFGHERVAVLDGGLPKWTREGRPVESGPASAPNELPGFTARLRRPLLATEADVGKASDMGDATVVDARDPARFSGREPESRPGLRSGHIPGSRNLPWPSLIDPDNGTLLPPEELRAAIDDAGIDLSKPIISSCGSGVTACVLALAAAVLAAPPVTVYDGSWTEWGRIGGPPIEKG